MPPLQGGSATQGAHGHYSPGKAAGAAPLPARTPALRV